MKIFVLKFVQIFLVNWVCIYAYAVEVNITSANGEKILILTQVLTRHGARAPVSPYENDPFQMESYWPNGWGQLTKLGKLGQYELGQFLRQKYTDFLDTKFTSKEIYAISSDYDRCIMSAQALLAGLYSNENVNSDEELQLFPVHTIPAEYDSLLQPKGDFSGNKDVYKCPKYNVLTSEVQNSPEMLKLTEDNLELFDFLRNNSGQSMETLMEAGHFINTLIAEDTHNLEIPSWAKDTISNPEILTTLAFGLKAMTLTDEMKKLAAGPLFSVLIANMKNKISVVAEEIEKRKMYIYSGHDLTLAHVMDTLGIFDPHWIPFSSALILEFYHDNSTMTETESEIGQHIIEVLYRNTTEADPHIMIIPGCNEPCTLEMFIELVSKFIPEDLAEECQLENKQIMNDINDNENNCLNNSYGAKSYILVAVIVTLTMLLIFVLVYHEMRR